MDKNPAAYLINLRSKKWWWSLFKFVLDSSINNSFQLNRMRNLDQGEKRLDAIEFIIVIVDS